jgi:TRAP-type uncharacterized transport system fused permease subunit
MKGIWWEIALVTVFALIGITALAASVEGYLLRPLNIFFRVILFVVAVAMIFPEFYSSIIGLAIFSVICIPQYINNKIKKEVIPESV